MSSTKRLSGECFEGERPLDAARMQRLIIEGRSGIRQKLVREQEIEEQGFSPYVTTTVRIDSEGEILESYLDVGQETLGKKQKFTARRIFAGCLSADTRILLGKLDLSLFNFGASSNHSDWRNASDFGLVFQKQNNRTNGEYVSGEWAQQGVGDFAMKLVILATEQVGVAVARVMALPLPVERLGELAGGNAKDSPFYPAIDMFGKAWDLQMLPQNMEPCRGDSLPVLPLFLYQGAPGTEPASLEAERGRTAMYAVWSNLAGVRGFTAAAFQQLVSVPSVDASPVEVEWAWPHLQQDQDVSSILDPDSDCEEGDDDEYNRSMAAMADGADAAEVARLTELANMGRIPVTTAPLVVTTALGTTTASTLASS